MKHAHCCLLACLLAVSTVASAGENPPAPGFDVAGSDARAVEIADQVMAALGGREAWDATRFVSWKFFGRRAHVWDKHTGDVRIEGVGREDDKPFLILMNLHSMEGRAWRDGEEVSGDELTELLDFGEAAWINDSYWMFMPYKLKDSGVTLTYVGPGTMEDGRPAEVLQLTFREVGRTPDNRYQVYVSTETGLVEQWDFYRQATDEEPGFRIPWHDWERHGAILLSANRGESGHTDVRVFDALPASVFTSPEPVDLAGLD